MAQAPALPGGACAPHPAARRGLSAGLSSAPRLLPGLLLSAGAARLPWTAGAARNAGGGPVAGTLAQPAASTQFVQVQVSALANGAPWDPTGDPVQMAFTAHSYPPSPPQSPGWQAASWETDPDGTYWASCLVGPANGGLALARGTWDCWVKVTDDPAVPVLQGPVLNIT